MFSSSLNFGEAMILTSRLIKWNIVHFETFSGPPATLWSKYCLMATAVPCSTRVRNPPELRSASQRMSSHPPGKRRAFVPQKL